MQPVLTPEEMRSVDARAAAEVPLETLVERAGTAVAAEAIELMGGTYGRRVEVLAGPGNNGADGRVAARLLARRGARVTLHEVGRDRPAPEAIGACDLVVDAAFGTGFRGEFDAPRLEPGARVLAVDVPSGLDAGTGELRGRALAAERTVTFGAWKPGLLQGAGRDLCGDVRVHRIGLPVEGAHCWVVEDADVTVLVERKARDAHKWRHAVLLVAGSPGMEGAATLCALGAMRAGAGTVRLAAGGANLGPLEAVRLGTSAGGGDGGEPEAILEEPLAEARVRCRATVAGPGLGRSRDVARVVAGLLDGAVAPPGGPTVLDADALWAVGPGWEGTAPPGLTPDHVLTPHDGEAEMLSGRRPGADRIAEARALATATGAVVLLKGPTTVVAHPDGRALVAISGPPSLATAGSGDVLAGVIGALCARGLEPLHAAGVAAHVHGRAARRCHAEGLMAGDLPGAVAAVLSELVGADGGDDT